MVIGSACVDIISYDHKIFMILIFLLILVIGSACVDIIALYYMIFMILIFDIDIGYWICRWKRCTGENLILEQKRSCL